MNRTGSGNGTVPRVSYADSTGRRLRSRILAMTTANLPGVIVVLMNPGSFWT
jgi:hypothetical protein